MRNEAKSKKYGSALRDGDHQLFEIVQSFFQQFDPGVPFFQLSRLQLHFFIQTLDGRQGHARLIHQSNV